MSEPDRPKRRFAPVPVETTFESNRKPNALPHAIPQPSGPHRIGPLPELTPDPSPTDPVPPVTLWSSKRQHLPQQQGRRRFAPQLIETSRRSRRVGDPGPATRPTDKTDITPYTNHIYNAKPKFRRKNDGSSVWESHSGPHPPTRRETEDETFKQYLLDIAAKEAERQIQEAALAAFPNSRAREGGVAHFYFREGSESDETPDDAAPAEDRKKARLRRKSSDADMGWWQQHMQAHAKQVQDQRSDMNGDGNKMDLDDEEIPQPTDAELDQMDLSTPPDPIWTTTSKKIAPEDRRDSMADATGPMGETHMSLSRPERPYVTGQTGTSPAATAKAAGKPSPSPFSPFAQSTAQSPQPGFNNVGTSPFGRPFGAFGLKSDPKLEAMRKAASPPMLGKDLVFRRCPSPKFTKLEPDHPFCEREQLDNMRDTTGQGGLWQGFCFKTQQSAAQAQKPQRHGPTYMATPMPPASPEDADQHEEEGEDGQSSHAISEEPASIFSSTTTASSSDATSLWNPNPTSSDHRSLNKPPTSASVTHNAKGDVAHLKNLSERLTLEQAKADKDDKIALEFDDDFVTQVYNYLSLGYPAMARAFDEELAKISHMDVLELGKDDANQMAKGNMLEVAAGEGERRPRWRALRTYITEWARQHPDLDNLDPLAWGVRERRGSWAI